MLGVSLALLSASMFAVNHILIQMGMKKSKDNGVFLNISINVVVLSLLYLIILFFKQEPINWQATAIIAFITAGICTTLLGRTTMFAAIRRIGPSRAAAIKNSSPLFTIIIAMIFLDEYLNLISGLGILLVMLGLFLLAYGEWKKNGTPGQQRPVLGFIFAGVAALCFGLGQATRKVGLLSMADPILGSLIGAATALIGYVLSLAFKKELGSTLKTQLKESNKYYVWAGIATTFGLLSFFMSANFTKISYTSAIAASEPVLTVFLAYLFLKQQENIQRTVIGSILLVFIGIVVISVSG